MSTGQVVNWINAQGKRIILVTDEVELIIHKLIISNIQNSIISINGENIRLGEISSIWFRKGGIKLKFHEECYRTIEPKMFQHITDEWKTVETLILNYFSTLNRIGDNNLSEANKLLMLQKAIDVGLEIPASYVLSDKGELLALFEKHTSLIIKPLSNLFGYLSEDKFLIHYTTPLFKSDCEQFPEKFFPILIQEQLDRLFEARITAVNGRLFPTAILPYQYGVSDIRKLSKDDKRYLPLKLPLDIADRITAFMKSISCTYGCIDMIVTHDYKYYFLEINPQGQYGAFAYYSGYNIDKLIAKSLI